MGYWDNRGRPEGSELREINGVKVTRFGTPVDSQRQKLYNFERRHMGNTITRQRLTRTEAIDLIARIFAAHGLQTPQIRFGGNATSTYIYRKFGRDTLRLATGWGMSVGTILHEVAHGVAYKYIEGLEAGHGPTFCRVYIDLVEKFADFNGVELRKLAREAKLKVRGKIEYQYVHRLSSKISTARPTISAQEKLIDVLVEKNKVATETPIKRGRGRPPGSKNKPKV